MFKSWERWGAALGVLAVAAWVVAFAIAHGSPDTQGSDAKITSWYASSSHQNSQIIGFFVFLAGTLCAVGFFAAVRERLAEASHTEMGALAFGAGCLSALCGMLGVAMFTAPAFVASDTRTSDVVPSTYRMLSDLGYECWVAGAVLGAIVVWAASAVALRTGILPRWFGWVGILAGVLQLFSLFFLPIFVWWAWILVTGALLTWRRPAATSPMPLAT